MFSFKKKAYGFFVELGEESALIARASAFEGPLVVEEMREVPAADDAVLKQAVAEVVGKRSSSAYMHARCGIFPAKRLVRRITLDPKRIKEQAYFPEICTQQFRIDPDKWTIAVLNAGDGTDFDSSRSNPGKEVIFAGGQHEDLLALQERLLGLGVFPERLELGTLVALGGLADYHTEVQLKTPTLVLELDGEATQAFIVSAGMLDMSRSIPHGLEAMVSVVQKELNLKDEESARKLFFSNTFDFTNMGGILTRKLVKELQSLIGFYEVQTGQSIGRVLCTRLPSKLAWLGGALAKELGVEQFKIDFGAWLKSHEIALPAATAASNLDPKWLGIFSLMISHDAAPAEKK